MQTSEKGLNLIASHEGCKLETYLCPAGVPTIGFGHTGPDVKPGMTISKDIALDFLRNDVKKIDGFLSNKFPSLTQYQHDSLVSLIFNIGIGRFEKSRLITKIEKLFNGAASEQEVKLEWMGFNKARTKSGLVELKGLTKRRAEEVALFFS